MERNLKIFTENIDPEAVNQVYTLISMPPFWGQQVRIMPDVHVGTGCVVGFTSTMGDKLIPNVLGVDLGCGMLCAELGNIPADYAAVDNFIRQKIPYGSAVGSSCEGEPIIKRLLCYKELRDMARLNGSAGSLGGGNHFIEMDVDEQGNKYLIIHSGSRNLGLQVAKIYQKRAVAACKNAAVAERDSVIASLKSTPEKIPAAVAEVNKKYAFRTKIPADMCYLDGPDMQEYLHDLKLCVEFASLNRKIMCRQITSFLGANKFTSFETVHNFLGEDGIIRKGAIPAHKGQKILIPLNMRDGCIVAEGKGNPDWNCSAPHGAGRALKRSEVKEYYSVEEYKSRMEGIYSTSVGEGTLDEAPFAYKPSEEIVRLIEPTAKILKIIKPVYNFKAGM